VKWITKSAAAKPLDGVQWVHEYMGGLWHIYNPPRAVIQFHIAVLGGVLRDFSYGSSALSLLMCTSIEYVLLITQR
jgi:hypothetical protein